MSESIFKKGSTTYFYASRFFPKDVRDDITTLYSFVRTADDYVDQVPQDRDGFAAFQQAALDALERGKPTDNPIIHAYRALAARCNFEPAWTRAFLTSMEADLHKHTYATYDELKTYIYGSADVIGLMIARILKLPENSLPYAATLGESMQLINFIRDIKEDAGLGRQYIPTADMVQFGVDNLMTCGEQEFTSLLRFEIERYQHIVAEAEQGFAYIPKRARVAIKTASDMYRWTARKIYQHPLIVREKKVKPKKWQVLLRGLQNTITG